MRRPIGDWSHGRTFGVFVGGSEAFGGVVGDERVRRAISGPYRRRGFHAVSVGDRFPPRRRAFTEELVSGLFKSLGLKELRWEIHKEDFEVWRLQCQQGDGGDITSGGRF